MIGALGTASHGTRPVTGVAHGRHLARGAGLLGAIPVFWALPTAFLSGAGAAAGIALIAVLGNLGGFAGPAFTGISEDSTGGYEMPLTVLAGLLVVGGLLALAARESADRHANCRAGAGRPALGADVD